MCNRARMCGIAAVLAASSAVAAGPPALVINEIDVDTPGFDTDEFIELYDGGSGSTNLGGFVVVLYNGNGDVSYGAFDLDGRATGAFGYFVIGSAGMPEADIEVDPGDFGWIQNGADAIALYQADAENFPPGTPVTAENLVDAIVYGTNDPDDDGLLAVLGGPQVNEANNGDSATDSIGRFPNGEGVQTVLDDPTPGASNGEQSVVVVINEILADPALGVPQGDANGDGIGTTEDQFIEIVNDTGASLDITAWRLLVDGDEVYVFPSGTILSDSCAAVIFGGGTPIGTFGGSELIVVPGGLGLSFLGGTVTITDDGGEVISEYTYGNEAANNQSITRDPDINGPDPLIAHTAAQGSQGLFSPGTFVNGLTFLGCSPPISPPENLFLSEVRVDQPGADFDEYFELRGDPFTSLDGVTYLVIGDDDAGSDSGVVEAVIDLDGEQIAADGLFLAVETTVGIVPTFLADLILPDGDLFENEDNVTHLLVANYFGSIGLDLDTDDNGTLDYLEREDVVAPWTDVLDGVAFVKEIVPSTTEHAYGAQLGFDEVGPVDDAAPGHVYGCSPVGFWLPGTFDEQDDEAADSPAAVNPGCGAGACCLPDGTCADDVAAADCGAMSGVFQGPGLVCGEIQCPGGACCLPGGNCADDIQAEACALAGGLFQGLGTVCAQVACPAGACCLPDGTCVDDVTADGCALAEGDFQGPASLCSESFCPGGACCLADGTCLEGTSEPDCAGQGGTWEGLGTLCAGVNCVGSCPGDVNGDGTVAVQDLVAVILAWGTDDMAADIDGSGIVDVSDLVDIILLWGDCP